ncbi:MAG: radical SAM protein [Magnetovibrionaceae bacterium]
MSDKSRQKFVCKHPWAHFEVNNPNGDVTMCCMNDTVLGNVNEDSVADIWNGEKFQKMRSRMLEEGAHAFCPHTCPVLRGGKKYENLDWYTELSEDGEVRQNAELNEDEYKARKVKLDSLPRWFRFTYSYACNLDCYHCYQREDAKMSLKLPAEFMEQVEEYARVAQMVYPFGGEPFFFSPVLDFLKNHPNNGEGRFYFITNATILTDKIYETLARLPIHCMAVSLDAATPESFETLRLRGRKGDWNEVMANMARLQELKRRKEFLFTTSMTLNSVNALEIETFVDLALSFEAEPLVMLVANPFQTVDFQKRFLMFTPDQFEEMAAQIERSLPKVREAGFEDAETYLLQLQKSLSYHRQYDNKPAKLAIKNVARKVYHALPEQLQIPARRALQEIRNRRFEG